MRSRARFCNGSPACLALLIAASFAGRLKSTLQKVGGAGSQVASTPSAVVPELDVLPWAVAGLAYMIRRPRRGGGAAG